MEIERKFLVKDKSFIDKAFKITHIIQGYICSDADRTVRIRICDKKGFLTIKSASNERGWSRYEFEHSIELKDAKELIQLCLPGIIDKHRHCVKVGQHIWEVDIFHGENEGLVVAEIELESEEESFERPSWMGEEVSGAARYYNSMLSMRPYLTWNKNNPDYLA